MNKDEAAKAKAQKILDKIREGQASFTRATHGWMIVGPAAMMVTGETIAVTKADGTTSDVKVGAVTLTKTVQGVDYAVAEIDGTDDCGVCPRGGRRYLSCPAHGEQARADADAQLERDVLALERPYDEVYDSTFGHGRRYRDQPGATQYDDGSGTFGVQIWDNA